MDIKNIVNSTKLYNFHSHTQFCDGRANMVDIVNAAIDAGLQHLGFTPHSPIPVESPCNMKAIDVDTYINEFNRLKSEYSDRINLYMSMEIDYLGEQWNAANAYFSSLPLDYRLSSIHFIPSQDGTLIDVDGSAARFIENVHKHFHSDIRYVVDTFYQHTLDMIELGGFDIIGHFDKIGWNASSFQPGIEDENWYRKHIDNVIDALKSSGIVVEINTKAWLPPVGCSAETAATYDSRLFPSPTVIRRLRDVDVTLAVNSDVHYTERITAGRDVAFGIIES